MAFWSDSARRIAYLLRRPRFESELSAAGLGLSVFAVRPLAMFLSPGVARIDPMSFAAIAAGLALVSALAALAPALRGLRIDPAVALRREWRP